MFETCREKGGEQREMFGESVFTRVDEKRVDKAIYLICGHANRKL
jgi:hypothetical protein